MRQENTVEKNAAGRLSSIKKYPARRTNRLAPRQRPLVAALLLALQSGIAMAPPFLGSMAMACLAMGGRDAAAQVNSLCSGSPTADCSDVTAAGIKYTSGVSEVNVGDSVGGTATIAPSTIGIELTRVGVSAVNAIDAEFLTIAWDADNNASTPSINVVSKDGLTPHMSDGHFILSNGGDPQTFTIDTQTYTPLQLVEHLATNSADAGATISGSLTVNNNAGSSSQGASLSTSNAVGLAVSSTGGGGGSGGCGTILFYSWCDDAYRGGDAGSVVVNNNASIIVTGDLAEKHGISAVSQGGVGGNGGGWFGFFASTPGRGGDGANGAAVFVTLGENSSISTEGDKSHGVFAQSRGGDGGSGGHATGMIALGENGGNGGSAGTVLVDNEGSIRTQGWNAHGIWARSVGAGAGSGSEADGLYAEGGNGGRQSNGAGVIVNNGGIVTTVSSDAFGILAQSIGGGGGDGGGAGGWFTVGGRAESGGGSGVVSVFDSGSVRTGGDRSTAIFAQSIGGGGGNGGGAASISETIGVAVGGDGGLGGAGNEVHVTTKGSDILTVGDDANGIRAQSVGGGGGNGGVAVSGTRPGSVPYNVSVAVGGDGGGGGSAGDIVRVETDAETIVFTSGNRSSGIAAQSIGGGGGNGGLSFAGSGGFGLSLAVSIGGKGGVAGQGKTVEVDNAGTIMTMGDLSAAIFAQSIGGGGGNGGFAGSLAIGGGAASVSLGGTGASGGAAGKVDIGNAGTIMTDGESAAGIFAQSIGGGGGNGGSAISGSIGLASVTTSVGGKGGAGNDGNLVDILNTGLIRTLGNNSAGVFAQSVGGGGGSGGDATSLSLAGPVAVAVGVGGNGGTGGNGGDVFVENAGRIEAQGPNSDGIFAQSIGGSGGSGGSATTGTLVFPIEIEGVEIPAISANVAVGGRGAGGGAAGEVEVRNSGTILTSDFLSNGVFAQSVGGSGGKGGHATNISIAFDATFTGKVAIGGSAGQGGVGNTVSVDTSGLIHTQGDFSNGVFAQSVGGGGGVGGNSTNVSLSITPPPTAPEDFIPTPSADFKLAIGGDGGDAATGGNVYVTNSGSVVTEGNFSAGVMAQSVGGAGGFGGDTRTIQVELTADPMDFLPLTDLTSLDMTFALGGSGGAGSNGGIAKVTNSNDIATTGVFAHGIVAQSVGGGGGSGGSAMTFEFSNADIVPEIPVLDDISGLTTLEMTLKGSGGGGGNGGAVTVNSEGRITTSGDFAMGVVAQSVAGGGGLAGFYNPQGITNNEIVNSVFNAVVDTEAGFSFAGSVGGAGTAGEVIVKHSGTIQTSGDGAHGLFAQSVAGQGAAGKVGVTLDGLISASGKDAYGIYAQSGGGSGNDDVTLEIKAGGVVQGGSGAGAGIRLLGGADNQLTNRGGVSALSGNAILAGDQNDVVDNYGTVSGSVLLGAGVNTFNNLSGGRFVSGADVALGAGNTLANQGVLSPGGNGLAQVTELTGQLLQTSDGALELDASLGGLSSDVLNVSGGADLAGGLRLNPIDLGFARPGDHQQVLVTSTDGVAANGLELLAPRSAVVSYALVLPNEDEIALGTHIDFAPAAMAANAQQVGEYVNAVQRAGGSANFAPIAASLVALPDSASLEAAYEMLSPGAAANTSSSSTAASGEFNNAMHSCRQREGDFRFVREGECNWLRVGGGGRDQRRTAHNDGYDLDTLTIAGGIQHEVQSDLHVGFGLSYQRSQLDTRYSSINGDRVEAGVMAKRRFDATRLSGSLSASYGHYDSARRIDFGLLEQVASASYKLWSVSAQGRVSHDLMQGDKAYIRPMLSAGVTYFTRGGFTEKGAGSANLDVARASDTVVTLQPAIEFGGERATDAGTLWRPHLRLGLTQYLTGYDSKVTATMTGAPDGVGSFSVTNRSDRTFADVVLGVDVLTVRGATISADYVGQFSRSSSTNTAWLKFSMPF